VLRKAEMTKSDAALPFAKDQPRTTFCTAILSAEEEVLRFFMLHASILSVLHSCTAIFSVDEEQERHFENEAIEM
jgi:hypothetical protein